MPLILKFDTNVRYDLLYCTKANQPFLYSVPFICPFFFLANKIFCHRVLGSNESHSIQILYVHIESGQ